ncbi:chemotaxis protein CheA, partial [bacterium]
MTDYRDPLGRAAKDFLAEAEEILEQLGGDLLALGESADRDECDPETVNSIFRSAHSLKGLAGMFGFTEIAELSHHLESLLDCLRLGKVALDDLALSVLFEAVDVLGAVVRGVGSSDEEMPELLPVLARIGACISGAQRESATPTPADLGISDRILLSLTEYEEHRLRENIGKGRELYLFHASYSLDSFDRELGELVDLLKGCGEVI